MAPDRASRSHIPNATLATGEPRTGLPGAHYPERVIVLLVVFVVAPLVELYVLAQVSHAVGGLGPALVALLAVSLLGAALVKRQGLGVLRNIRRELNANRLPTEHVAEGGLVLLAGALLVVPGFVTDLLGALLLVPPLRRRLAGFLRRRQAARHGRAITVTYTGADVVDAHTTASGQGPPYGQLASGSDPIDGQGPRSW